MKNILLPLRLRRPNPDLQFLVASFLLLTVLAFVYGVRSSFHYAFKGVPVYWFHLSYHYLAASWTWVLMLPVLLGFSKRFRLKNSYPLLAIFLAVPVSALHRFLSLFLDAAFRWSMGYTSVNPIDAMESFKPQFFTGVFDSILTYSLILVALHIFYSRFGNSKGENSSKTFSIASFLSGLWKKQPTEIARSTAKMERLVAKKNGRFVFLKLTEISSFKSEGNYMKVYNGTDWVIIRETMKSMELKLDPKNFFRVNRSTIVNVNFVRDLEPWFNGEYSISLHDGSVVNTSKTYRENIDRLLNG
jgi:hypothetical protein